VSADDAGWQFDGKDSEGWKLGPRTANLRVADGKLQFDITGPDSWIISPQLDLTVTPQTKVVIRMSSEDGDAGQLYWQSVGPDGKPLPYSEERVVRGFPAASDGKVHEYHVLPTWEGKVREVRLDPPGDHGHVAIDSIRIQTVDIPLAEQLRCEFSAKEAEHWVHEGMRFLGVQGGVLNAEVDYTGRIGATLKGMGLTQSNEEGSGIIRPNLRIDANTQTNIAVRMSVSEGTLASVRWYSDLDSNSHASWQDFFIKPDGRFHTYNVDLRQHPTWKSTIRRLELIVNSPPGAAIGLDYVRTGDTPDGPPLLGIGYLSTERVLYGEGERATVRCLVRNDGGARVKDIRAIIQVPGREGEYEQITEVPPLSPGQACEVQWALKTEGSLAAVLGGRAVYEDGPYPTAVCRLIVTGPRDGSSSVGNDRVRLVFTKNSYGFGPAFLEMKRGVLWECCGVLPSLGEVVYRSNKGGAFQKMIFGEGSKGAFKCAFKDVDGVAWSAKATFTPDKKGPWIKAEYTISANANRELIAFRGPMLYAGEGAFGAEKDAAIFPGLEWLVEGEHSSNWLDATPPRSNRWAPDPYRVTIPLMAVLADRKLVGLMWNALDRWDEQSWCVTPHFLSPNWHAAQSNHLMSLFVPSIPQWVVENSIFATRSYALRKDKVLKITCYLFAQEADDVLQAAKNWFEVFGVPELPKKPRSHEAELDLCMDYFNSRWDGKEKCWRNWREQKIGPSGFLDLYVSYLDCAQDTPLARKARDIVETIMAIYKQSPQRPFGLATTQRCWPMWSARPALSRSACFAPS
ncbi:MAG: hypothetical protein KJ749_06830, partial [Planctomycetes bacterium]|nr:hypothetical protein [Planctomycetota bacterium]